MPAALPSPVYPLINGNRYDYTSLEVMIAGIPYRGVKAIDYEDSLDTKKSYGTSARPLGRNRGIYDAGGSIELFREDWNIIAPALAVLGNGGIGEANFLIVAVYGDFGAMTVTDKLIGCRVKKPSHSYSQGASELTVKCELDIMEVTRNGLSLLSPITMVK